MVPDKEIVRISRKLERDKVSKNASIADIQAKYGCSYDVAKTCRELFLEKNVRTVDCCEDVIKSVLQDFCRADASFGLSKIYVMEFPLDCNESSDSYAIRVEQERDGYFYLNEMLTSSTMAVMEEKYELESKDVKSCIAALLRKYGVVIKTMRFTPPGVEENRVLSKRIVDMNNCSQSAMALYNCAMQMRNMYLFFDE